MSLKANNVKQIRKTKNPIFIVTWNKNALASGRLTRNSVTFSFNELYTLSTDPKGGLQTVCKYIQRGNRRKKKYIVPMIINKVQKMKDMKEIFTVEPTY